MHKKIMNIALLTLLGLASHQVHAMFKIVAKMEEVTRFLLDNGDLLKAMGHLEPSQPASSKTLMQDLQEKIDYIDTKAFWVIAASERDFAQQRTNIQAALAARGDASVFDMNIVQQASTENLPLPDTKDARNNLIDANCIASLDDAALKELQSFNARETQKWKNLLARFQARRRALVIKMNILESLQHLEPARSQVIKAIQNRKRTEYSPEILNKIELKCRSKKMLAERIEQIYGTTQAPQSLIEKLDRESTVMLLETWGHNALIRPLEKELSLISAVLDAKSTSHSSGEIDAAIASIQAANRGVIVDCQMVESLLILDTSALENRKKEVVSAIEYVKNMRDELVEKADAVDARMELLEPQEVEDHVWPARSQVMNALKSRKGTEYSPEILNKIELKCRLKKMSAEDIEQIYGKKEAPQSLIDKIGRESDIIMRELYCHDKLTRDFNTELSLISAILDAKNPSHAGDETDAAIASLRAAKRSVKDRKMLEALLPLDAGALENRKKETLSAAECVKKMRREKYLELIKVLTRKTKLCHDTHVNRVKIPVLNAIKNKARTEYSPEMLHNLELQYHAKKMLAEEHAVTVSAQSIVPTIVPVEMHQNTLVEDLEDELMIVEGNLIDQDGLIASLEKELHNISQLVDREIACRAITPASQKDLREITITSYQRVQEQEQSKLENARRVKEELREKQDALIARIELLNPNQIQDLEPRLQVLNAIKSRQRTEYSSEMLHDLEIKYGSKMQEPQREEEEDIEGRDAALMSEAVSLVREPIQQSGASSTEKENASSAMINAPSINDCITNADTNILMNLDFTDIASLEQARVEQARLEFDNNECQKRLGYSQLLNILVPGRSDILNAIKEGVSLKPVRKQLKNTPIAKQKKSLTITISRNMDDEDDDFGSVQSSVNVRDMFGMSAASSSMPHVDDEKDYVIVEHKDRKFSKRNIQRSQNRGMLGWIFGSK
jgi:hypothetical protein